MKYFKKGLLIMFLMPQLFILTLCGCKKLVDVDPPVNRATQSAVFSDDATAIAVLTGIYTRISSNSFSFSTDGLNLISKLSGLSADELTLWSGATLGDMAYYQNKLEASLQNSYGHEMWNTCYQLLGTCNSALESLETSSSLTPSVKDQLKGEAKFMRGFLYFYLVNLYGEVPIVKETDYKVNRLTPRSSKTAVYQFIIAELKDAQTLLNTSYLNSQLKSYSGTPERLRPTSWAATAMLARAYLFSGDFANAESEATKIISNTALFGPLASVPLNSVFLKNSRETIWQLQPVSKFNDLFLGTSEALFFVLPEVVPGVNSYHLAYMSPQLYSAFELNDERKNNWVGTYTDGTGTYFFPYKYSLTIGTSDMSSITEYTTVLRLAEQYLIRAEARAQQNNISGAQTDLNAIRNRAGLPNTTANDKATLQAAILHERQVELFTEWGHRWLDLKRTGKVDEVMTVVTPLKANGEVWKSYQQWYPLPLQDIQRDPSLVQNSGY